MSASNNMAESDNIACRLCGGSLSYRFNLRIMRESDVGYFECGKCKSLQTEPPTWLDRAYRHNLSNLDTGAVQRNLHNLAAAYVTCKIFGLRNVLDIGGGNGLLCRLLRDYRINCFANDPNAIPHYNQNYTEPDFAAADMLTAFEVIEHFPNPASDLETIFGAGASIILISTNLYEKADRSWWYLAPEGGQHVFFYSRPAISWIAGKYGYQFVLSGGYMLFARPDSISKTKRILSRVLLSRSACRLLKAMLMLMPARGAWDDHLAQKASLDTNG